MKSLTIIIFYYILWLIHLLFPKHYGVKSNWNKGQLPINILSGFITVIGVSLAPIYYLLKQDYSILNIIGLILMAIGLIGEYLARKELGKFYTNQLGIQPGHKLIKTGLYKWVDHPGYLSNIYFLIGCSLSLGDWFIFALAFIYNILLEKRIKIEDKMLETLNWATKDNSEPIIANGMVYGRGLKNDIDCPYTDMVNCHYEPGRGLVKDNLNLPMSAKTKSINAKEA
jgi:isoprenylcysteine carboxyl methyltransferase (ICMT) family protein YpbQ